MKEITIHAILEYGLGDYDDTEYICEVDDEEYDILSDAIARKAPFDDDEACQDIYHNLFQDIFVKEKARYMQNVYDGADPEEVLVEGEDFLPFEDHAFYLAL